MLSEGNALLFTVGVVVPLMLYGLYQIFGPTKEERKKIRRRRKYK